MNKDNNYFKENRLELIAYLLAHSPIVTQDGTEVIGGRVYVRFAPFDKASELVDDYYKDKTMSVSPKRLFQCFTDARNLVFTRRDQEGLGGRR